MIKQQIISTEDQGKMTEHQREFSLSLINLFFFFWTRAPYAVNELSSLAFRSFGAGHAALTQFALFLNMPKPVNRKSVAQHILNDTRAAEDEVGVSTANVARDLEEKDITVSFDGS